MDLINPPELGEPRGWTNGIVVPAGASVLVIAGQTGTRPNGEMAADFTAQFDTALARLLKVVEQAGGRAEHVVRMRVYVTDLEAYQTARQAIGEKWRARMGRHYPAMTLVEVSRLLDPRALVEIEGTAAVPGASAGG